MRWLLLLLLAPSLVSAECSPSRVTCPEGQGCIYVGTWECRPLCDERTLTKDARETAVAAATRANPDMWVDGLQWDAWWRAVERHLGCSLNLIPVTIPALPQ